MEERGVIENVGEFGCKVLCREGVCLDKLYPCVRLHTAKVLFSLPFLTSDFIIIGKEACVCNKVTQIVIVII